MPWSISAAEPGLTLTERAHSNFTENRGGMSENGELAILPRSITGAYPLKLFAGACGCCWLTKKALNLVGSGGEAGEGPLSLCNMRASLSAKKKPLISAKAASPP